MNSNSTVQSPYFSSEIRSDAGLTLITSDPPSLTMSLLGALGSTSAVPTVHCPLSGWWSFQPGGILLSSEQAGAARARAATRGARRVGDIVRLRDVNRG